MHGLITPITGAIVAIAAIAIIGTHPAAAVGAGRTLFKGLGSVTGVATLQPVSWGGWSVGHQGR